MSGPTPDEVSAVSRRLRARADGMLAEAWFMPEAQTGLTELGIGPAATMFGGRIGALGPVPGVAAAALLVPVRPESVAAAVDEAWAATTPETLLAVRERVATGYVARDPRCRARGPRAGGRPGPACGRRRSGGRAPVGVGPPRPRLDGRPPRRPLAGLRADPGAAPRVPPQRVDGGGTRTRASCACITDLWRGPLISSVSGSWSADEQSAARERLEARGLVAGDEITDAGRVLRDAIEAATDAQETAVVVALGDDADELLARLAPWSTAVVEWAGRQFAAG